jgi:hypothetical protein
MMDPKHHNRQLPIIVRRQWRAGEHVICYSATKHLQWLKTYESGIGTNWPARDAYLVAWYE